MLKQKLAHFPIGQLIIGSHIFAIIVGTLLLALPQARVISLSWLDLLFTATSATCVTGLFTISLESFTLLGKAILLVLIQLGGLGIITLTLFFLSFVIDLGLTGQFMAEKILEIDSWKEIKRLLICIILITLLSEMIGALLFFFVLAPNFDTTHAAFYALFHAISSFCSAGISILPNGIFPYASSLPFLFVTITLMFIGGLGFITWYEIFEYLKTMRAKRPHQFSLHSKIILYGSVALIVSTAIIFWILERHNTLAQTPSTLLIPTALFQAISFRSTGFMLMPLPALELSTLFLIMIVSFIGSSPGSTGSGIKITTFAIFLATVKSAISGRVSVEIKGRKIPKDQVYRAVAIVTIGIGWICLTTFFLLITEPDWRFIDALFEACAAFTTFGTSTGVTPSLSGPGKLFIILSMILGRIGSFSLLLALKLKRQSDAMPFEYPEERVMLG